MRRFAVLILIPLALSACADRGLRQVTHDGDGPDEFMIAPVKPLEEPSNYNTLPVPTPGQSNLTDRSAVAEGIVAFGGRPDTGTTVPASEAALVQHASRLGVTPGVRLELAQADAAFRKRKGRFTRIRLVPVDRYNQAYRSQSLDALAEEARWQRAGARTPSAPPPARTRFP